jgi:hypothetical protein
MVVYVPTDTSAHCSKPLQEAVGVTRPLVPAQVQSIQGWTWQILQGVATDHWSVLFPLVTGQETLQRSIPIRPLKSTDAILEMLWKKTLVSLRKFRVVFIRAYYRQKKTSFLLDKFRVIFIRAYYSQQKTSFLLDKFRVIFIRAYCSQEKTSFLLDKFRVIFIRAYYSQQKTSFLLDKFRWSPLCFLCFLPFSLVKTTQDLDRLDITCLRLNSANKHKRFSYLNCAVLAGSRFSEAPFL